jgi:hypothetical protein
MKSTHVAGIPPQKRVIDSLTVKVACQDSIFKAAVRKPRLADPFDIVRAALFSFD